MGQDITKLTPFSIILLCKIYKLSIHNSRSISFLTLYQGNRKPSQNIASIVYVKKILFRLI